MVLRVEAYLRIACSVLGFDIGELWCARNVPGEISLFFFVLQNIIFLTGQEPTLRFIQLYSSPTYEDFHNILVPEGTSPQPQNDDSKNAKHRFSPIVCQFIR